MCRFCLDVPSWCDFNKALFIENLQRTLRKASDQQETTMIGPILAASCLISLHAAAEADETKVGRIPCVSHAAYYKSSQGAI